MSASKNITENIFEGTPAKSTERIGPDQTWVVDGLDWSWAYIVHRPMPGFLGYRIGSDGSAWSSRRQVAGSGPRRWTRIKPMMHQGYEKVRFYRSHHDWEDIRVHVAVLTAFVGDCPKGMEGCHAPDPRRNNNKLSNLRWDTRSENIKDAYRYRNSKGIPHPKGGVKGESHSKAKLANDDVIAIRLLAENGASNESISIQYGLEITHVSHILTGKNWGHLDPVGLARLKAVRLAAIRNGKARPRRGAKGLIETEVIQVRKDYADGVKIKGLVQKFGVSKAVISAVVHRKTWKHLV